MSKKIRNTMRDFNEIKKETLRLFDMNDVPIASRLDCKMINELPDMCVLASRELKDGSLISMQILTTIPTQRIFDMMAHLNMEHNIIVECELIGHMYCTIKECDLTYYFEVKKEKIHKLAKHLKMLSKEHMKSESL